MAKSIGSFAEDIINKDFQQIQEGAGTSLGTDESQILAGPQVDIKNVEVSESFVKSLLGESYSNVEDIEESPEPTLFGNPIESPQILLDKLNSLIAEARKVIEEMTTAGMIGVNMAGSKRSGKKAKRKKNTGKESNMKKNVGKKSSSLKKKLGKEPSAKVKKLLKKLTPREQARADSYEDEGGAVDPDKYGNKRESREHFASTVRENLFEQKIREELALRELSTILFECESPKEIRDILLEVKASTIGKQMGRANV